MPTYKDRITTYERKMTTTCSLSLARSLSLSLDSLSLIFSASNFRVMGDLLKNLSDHSPRVIRVHLPTPPCRFPPTHERKPEINFPHLNKSRHVSTTVGQITLLRGRVGREKRIIYQRSKQEKAYLTSLESRWRLPTVEGRGKRAAL